MILQEIIFPKKEICSEKELYYRGNLEKDKNRYIIKNGEIVEFNTYFNSFSVEKWKKYTNIKKLILNLTISGICEINIKNKYYENKILKEDIIQTISVNEKNEKSIQIPMEILKLKGIISFEINGIQDCIIHKGNWSDDENRELNDVKIGICICTFKREEFVKRNVNMLKDKILDNDNSQMRDKLQIFVVDNAQTLDEKEFEHKNIHFIKNKNVGGAGGFTRGIIEATFKSNNNITNCILMDDDIIFDSSVVEKTYSFLSLLKKEYSKCMIGGAMLLENNRGIQAVSGEQWNGKNRVMRNANLDLIVEENIVKNELEGEINYNGWWYCCIPTSIITRNNLPLPIFIHMDDVEYGIRNQNGLIVLNGIGVWHPDFVNKGPITNTYYNVRNKLIIDSKYGQNKKFNTKMYLLTIVLYYLCQYKYAEAELALRGYKDYYSGIDNFKKIDAEELHKNLLTYRYNMVESNIKIDKEMKSDTIISKLLKCIKGVIGYIMPKFLDKKVYTSNVAVVSTAFAKKITILNIENKKEYNLERDYKRLKNCLKEYRKIAKIIDKEHNQINQEWKNRFEEITNFEFWNKYLELKWRKEI